MAQFADNQDYATLADFKVAYTALFVEKGKAYEAEQKAMNQKTEVAEGRCYNMHHLDDSESPMDVLSIDDMADIVIKTDDSAAGCENARVEWGKKMSEQAFITLLNCVVRDLNRNGVFTRGYIRQQWRDIWFTSHTFRRAGAQYRFMFAPPERRWSLRMVKWWAVWTQNESAETLVRFLLDQAATDEDTQLADCLAPARESHVGCPTTFSRQKCNTTVPA
ncbi:hypothetical protein JG687_00016102 [Phytophthora cactorum]|uniref:Uncharacterized protein n=3 Tax=Phytophthora cactorum TaxID=29920 RepID=A0A8T1TRJ0_9STRA|nr:hypothetical protein JG687_00016102 [Phytophthora cactorum]